MTTTLDAARDAFLECIACGTYTTDTDLNAADIPVTTHTLVVKDFEFRQLVEALGIRLRFDQPTEDAILRAVED